jgi:hypothetical protein
VPAVPIRSGDAACVLLGVLFFLRTLSFLYVIFLKKWLLGCDFRISLLGCVLRISPSIERSIGLRLWNRHQ